MAHRLLIYGVTGYAGQLIVKAAHELGFAPVLAGRDGAGVLKVAAELGFDARSLRLDNIDLLTDALSDIDVVLLTAGPFGETSAPMVEACLRSGTHYLDISGEIGIFEACAEKDERARKAGVMLLPGCGFDVVPSDCLAAHVAERLANPSKLTIGIRGFGRLSRGMRKAMVTTMGDGTSVRRDGRIVTLGHSNSTKLDFGSGPESAVGLGWADVSAAFHSTGIPNIDVYFSSSKPLEKMASRHRRMGWLYKTEFMQRRLMRRAARGSAGPSKRQRQKERVTIWAKAESNQGRTAAAILETPDAYSVTVETSLEIARRVLNGDFKPGFQTPAKLYGADFVMGFQGVSRKDLVDDKLSLET